MQAEQVIVGLFVYQLTGSSAWVGISLALFFAPMLIVGVPAGALADRFDRRAVLVRTEFAMAAAAGVFALLLIIGVAGLKTALVMSVVSGVIRSVHHPARLSYTGAIAGTNRLLTALSLLSIVTRFGQLLGALAAGAISETYGPGIAYTVLVLVHVLAMGCFFMTQENSGHTPSPVNDQPESVHSAIVEYLQLLRSSRTMILLVVFASFIEVFGFSFATALPEMAVERLALDAEGLGLMHAARAGGGLCGALLLSVLVISQLGRLFLLVMSGFGVALLLLAVAPYLTTVLLCIALVAVFASAADILVQGMLQLSVPDASRGRAMGAWVVALGMGPIGHIELGLLVSLVGTTAALSVNGVLLLLCGLTALVFTRSIPAIRSCDPASHNPD